MKIDNNIYPIEYVGEKILEYNKSMVPPIGGTAKHADTFNLYKLVNKSSDTVWVNTIKPLLDTSMYFVKDTSIKELTKNRISLRDFDKGWLILSDGNCWSNCDYHVCVLPTQSLFFTMGVKGKLSYDSTQFDIYIKIKKGKKAVDSTLTKRLVFIKNNFVDDTSKWTN
ncbi:MAG: hypothetical protein JNK50_13660 [Bacteroidia bacterium]|nr:hypothetical protein [Bacteroidia bacterium]